METRIVQALFDKRWLLFAFSLLILVAATTGLKQLKFDGSTGFFFGENHPQMKIWNEFSDTFGSTQKAMLMLKHKDGQNLLESKAMLGLLEGLTEEFSLIENTVSVESIQNYQYTYSNEDELIVENTYDNAFDLSNEDIQHIQTIVLNEPALLGRLVNKSGDILIIVITGKFLGDEAVELQKLAMTDKIYAIRDRVRKDYPELDAYANGNIVGNAVTMKGVTDDLTTYIPLMYLIIYGLLALLLRSVLSMLTIAFTATFCTLSSIGIACWVGITLSPLSLSSMSIIVITTVAHCVHVVIAYLHNYRHGMAKVEALKESYRINLQPIFFTSLTTALGFLSMNMSEMQPARDLGNIVAIGVSVSFLFSLALLPTFLLLMPISNTRKETKTLNSVSEKACDLVINNPKGCLFGSVLLALLLGYLASNNIITERMTENIKYPNPFRYSTDAFDEALGGVYTLQYTLRSGKKNGVSDPEYLANLEKFTNYLRQHENSNISNVFSYIDVIKRLNKNMHSDNPAFNTIPESHDLAAQFLLLYEMSLPQGQSISNQISFDKSSTRLVANIKTIDAVTYLALQKEIHEWQKNNLPKVMQDYGTSDSSMWSHLSINVLNNSLTSAFTALFLISIVLMGILRSFKYGFISLAPNMLPGIAGFGFWAVYSGEINLALMSVLSITIGIVVDDTVHFLSKYIRAKKEKGFNAKQAVQYAFENVGPAITLTTIILTAGFASLALSPFLANSNMGIIIAVIIFAALIFDFFLLPAILLLVDKDKKAA